MCFVFENSQLSECVTDINLVSKIISESWERGYRCMILFMSSLLFNSDSSAKQKI